MIYDDVTELVDELRLMWHRTVTATERIHDGAAVTVPMRAVLEYVRANGPHTVSAMARARSVSRQHIQALVNDLSSLGLVQRLANPDHQRAPLIALTDDGLATIGRMHARERALLEPLLGEVAALTGERVRDAATVVRAVGETMAIAGGSR